MPETVLHRPSKRAIALFAATLAATLGFAGLSVASSSPASAHTPNASATCEKLTVTTASYSAGADNTVTVQIDGATVDDDTSFGTSFSKSYPFVNDTEAHDWVVKVHTSDDPDGHLGYSVTDTGTSTPCVPAITPPTVSANAEACTVPGGEAGKIDAEFGVTADRDYTVSVARASGGAPLSTKPLDVAHGATTASASFGDLPTGDGYMVTIIDTTAKISASDDVVLGDCPDIPPTVVASSTSTTCTADGASVGSISAVVDGDSTHGFVIDLLDAHGTSTDRRSTDGPATVTFGGLTSNSTLHGAGHGCRHARSGELRPDHGACLCAASHHTDAHDRDRGLLLADQRRAGRDRFRPGTDRHRGRRRAAARWSSGRSSRDVAPLARAIRRRCILCGRHGGGAGDRHRRSPALRRGVARWSDDLPRERGGPRRQRQPCLPCPRPHRLRRERAAAHPHRGHRDRCGGERRFRRRSRPVRRAQAGVEHTRRAVRFSGSLSWACSPSVSGSSCRWW